VAGIKTRSSGLVAGRPGDLAAVYGPFGAIWRGAILALFERPVEDGVMLMDGLFVAEGARGRGVGTALLAAVEERARAEGCAEVRLDVVDGNRARALYEREGFRETARFEAGLLGLVLNFPGATTMRRPVG
jgi:GNAT superfamily N-acetyltransferase